MLPEWVQTSEYRSLFPSQLVQIIGLYFPIPLSETDMHIRFLTACTLTLLSSPNPVHYFDKALLNKSPRDHNVHLESKQLKSKNVNCPCLTTESFDHVNETTSDCAHCLWTFEGRATSGGKSSFVDSKIEQGVLLFISTKFLWWNQWKRGLNGESFSVSSRP